MAKEEYRDSESHTSIRLHNPTHSRVKAHNRESETLAGTIDRALDALEREQNLPDAVRALMIPGEAVGLPEFDFDKIDADELAAELEAEDDG